MEITGLLGKTASWMLISFSLKKQKINQRRNAAAPEPLPRVHSASLLPPGPIWLGQEGASPRQKRAAKAPSGHRSPLRAGVLGTSPDAAPAETRAPEPERNGRKLTGASKPGRKFECKSLSGKGPLARALETTPPQLGPPCPAPAWSLRAARLMAPPESASVPPSCTCPWGGLRWTSGHLCVLQSVCEAEKGQERPPVLCQGSSFYPWSPTSRAPKASREVGCQPGAETGNIPSTKGM